MAGLQLLSDEGFRIDGRRPHELRRVQCKMGVFSQADGSAYVEQGNTKVLATIYGPHEAQRARASETCAVLNCQYSMAVFSTGERKQRMHGDRKSLHLTESLRQTFAAAILTSLYARSQIDIYIEVMHSDGGDYCVAINAATLALIDAGIALRGAVCACSATLVDERPLVDVNYVEEAAGDRPCVAVAILPRTGELLSLEMNGRLHGDHLAAVLDVAVDGCRGVHTLLDRAVREHVTATSCITV